MVCWLLPSERMVSKVWTSSYGGTLRQWLLALVEGSLRTRNTSQLNLQNSLSLVQLRHGSGSRDVVVGLNLHRDSSFFSVSHAAQWHHSPRRVAVTTPLMVRMSLCITCGGDGTDLRDARGLGSALGSFSMPRGANSKPGKLCHVAP